MLTRLALSQSLREIAEVSLALIPTYGEEGFTPGSYSAVIRRLTMLSKRARVLAVLSDRIVLSAPWTVIDRQLGFRNGTAEDLFGEMEQRWRAGDAAPWAPVFIALDELADDAPAAAEIRSRYYPLELGDPERLVAELDRFCQQHNPPERGSRGRLQHRRQVSGDLPGIARD